MLLFLLQDIHSLVLERYVFLNNNAKEFASGEIKRLKFALDDIKAACIALENIYIILPADKDFQLANDRLQNL